MKNFSWEQAPRLPSPPLWHYKNIGHIKANIEGVLIKTFLIGASKLLPFPYVSNKHPLYIWVSLPHPFGLVVLMSFESWLRGCFLSMLLVGTHNKNVWGFLTAFDNVLCTLNFVKHRSNYVLYEDVLSCRWIFR